MPLQELAETNILRQRLQRNNFKLRFLTTRLRFFIINKTAEACHYVGWLYPKEKIIWMAMIFIEYWQML